MASKRAMKSMRVCAKIGHGRLHKGVCARCGAEFSTMVPMKYKLSLQGAYENGYITMQDEINMLAVLKRGQTPRYNRHGKRESHYEMCKRICEAHPLPAKVRFTNWVKHQQANFGLVDFKVERDRTKQVDEEAFFEEIIAANAAIFFGDTKPWSDDPAA